MPSDLPNKIERDLSVGTAWLVVLATIAGADEPIHGYEIARRLADEAPEGLSFKQGTLYPMLRTMEVDGLIRSTLVPSNEGPARKCFTLTADGKRVAIEVSMSFEHHPDGDTTTVLAFTPSWVCHRRKWRVDGMDVTVCGYGAHARAGLNPQSLKREVWLRSVYTIHIPHLFVDNKASMTWSQARELWSACVNFGLEYWANRKIWYGWEGKWDAV
jgi:PadR family transcriptional regulator PadR